jgi:hypothetical protein
MNRANPHDLVKASAYQPHQKDTRGEALDLPELGTQRRAEYAIGRAA